MMWSIEPQSAKEVQLVFPLPITATWKDAQLIMSEPGKEPSILPLGGPIPPLKHLIKLSFGGQAQVEQVTYRIVAATLDLDSDGERADQGKYFLTLTTRVTNGSNAPGGMALIPNDFRLIVNGLFQEPIKAPIEVLGPNSTKEGEAYIASLSEDSLEQTMDLSRLGFGTVTGGWILSNLVLGHTHNMTGEVSCLKGLQSFKGYPF